MLTRPWLEVTTTVEGRLGSMLMKAGVEEKGIGGRGRIIRKSYTLTSGSGKGRACLTNRQIVRGKPMKRQAPPSHTQPNCKNKITRRLETLNPAVMGHDLTLWAV
jgi:hypothetical protein